jgi:hypothetical protein
VSTTHQYKRDDIRNWVVKNERDPHDGNVLNVNAGHRYGIANIRNMSQFCTKLWLWVTIWRNS